MAEKIDLEKCNFGTSEAQWPWPWIGSRSHWYTYLVEVCPHTKLHQNQYRLLWTYRGTHGHTHPTSGDDLKMKAAANGRIKDKCTTILEANIWWQPHITSLKTFVTLNAFHGELCQAKKTNNDILLVNGHFQWQYHSTAYLCLMSQ